MKKRLAILFLCILSLFTTSLKAQDFFSTEDAPTFFSFGARLGFNTSNRSFPSGHFNLWNNNSWGTGFNLGVLANLNFKDYLSVQPGIFFESRSGNFSYITDYIDSNAVISEFNQFGHWRGYYFTIPIMGVVKFNLSENIKWSVEFGPYFQFSLKQSGQKDLVVFDRLPTPGFFTPHPASLNSFDFGFKMGTGLTFNQHYYVGVHYLAGACNAWGTPSGGKNKSWMFTIGYDL